MGARNSKPIVQPREIQQKINTTSKEYENIKLHFQRLSKSYNLSAGRITKDVFISSYLRPRFPSFGVDLLERLFIVLAFDGKDYLVFEEFLQTKYLLDHVPPEPQQVIAKSANEFYTEQELIHQHRLRLIFSLFDLDFDGYISSKEYQKVIPILMQNDRQMDMEQMRQYDNWFGAISLFAMKQFDRQRLDRLSWRDFRLLARHDLTVKNIMDMITPKENEYNCIKYARAIQRKNEKKKLKQDQKKKEKLKDPERQLKHSIKAIQQTLQSTDDAKEIHKVQPLTQ
eukprot:226152_1